MYLGKVYTEEQLAKLSEEEVEKLFYNYKAKLSGQIVRLLGHSVINMYSIGACAVLGITSQDALSEDLENDPFLNCALQRFTCELYYRFGSFLAPLSIAIIRADIVYQNVIKMEEQVKQVKWKTNKNSLTSSKYEGLHEVGPLQGLTAAMAAELMIDFWFEIGAILAIKMVNNLEELKRR